jgi:hypothetical protein
VPLRDGMVPDELELLDWEDLLCEEEPLDLLLTVVLLFEDELLLIVMVWAVAPKAATAKMTPIIFFIRCSLLVEINFSS